LSLLAVDVDGVGVVWVEDQGVDVCELVGLGANFAFDEVVLALVVEDQVGALGRAANVWAKHDVVIGVAIVVGLLNSVWVELQVTTTAIDRLWMRNRVLEVQSLALVRELGEFGGGLVETGVLRRLQTLLGIGIGGILGGGDLENTLGAFGFLILADDPSRLPIA